MKKEFGIFCSLKGTKWFSELQEPKFLFYILFLFLLFKELPVCQRLCTCHSDHKYFCKNLEGLTSVQVGISRKSKLAKDCQMDFFLPWILLSLACLSPLSFHSSHGAMLCFTNRWHCPTYDLQRCKNTSYLWGLRSHNRMNSTLSRCRTEIFSIKFPYLRNPRMAGPREGRPFPAALLFQGFSFLSTWRIVTNSLLSGSW